MVRSGAVDIVLAYALDRLSRKQTHVAILAEEIDRAGGTLAFVTEVFEESAIGTYLRSTKAFLAEMHREKIIENTHRGMMARMKSGKLKPGPRPLYGYCWADDKHTRFAIDPVTGPVVERIFLMARDGISLRRIADALNADLTPTPAGRVGGWTFPNIPKVLQKQAYMGVAVQHTATRKRVNGKYVTTRRPPDQHVHFPEGTIPPIVTADTFAAVQQRMQRNKQEATRNHKHPESFLLRGGFVRCPECGGVVRSSYASDGHGGERARYVINDPHAHPGCTRCAIAAQILDDAVWKKVRALIMRKGVVEREVEGRLTSDPTAASRATVDRLIADTMRKRDNLTRALANLDDADAQASVLTDLQAMTKRLRELNDERDALFAQQDEWQVSQEQLRNLNGWLDTVRANIDTMTYDQRRELLTALDVRVLLYPASHTPRYEASASLPLDVSDEGTIEYSSVA
jgi:hypothetical protein